MLLADPDVVLVVLLVVVVLLLVVQVSVLHRPGPLLQVVR